MAKKKNGLLKFAVGVGAAAVAGKVAYDKVKAAKNKLTKEELLEHITDKTKILIMPFPNNPRIPKNRA